MKNCTSFWRGVQVHAKSVKHWGSQKIFGSWDVEKVDAVKARSTVEVKSAKKLEVTGHFLRLECGFATFLFFYFFLHPHLLSPDSFSYQIFFLLHFSSLTLPTSAFLTVYWHTWEYKAFWPLDMWQMVPWNTESHQLGRLQNPPVSLPDRLRSCFKTLVSSVFKRYLHMFLPDVYRLLLVFTRWKSEATIESFLMDVKERGRRYQICALWASFPPESITMKEKESVWYIVYSIQFTTYLPNCIGPRRNIEETNFEHASFRSLFISAAWPVCLTDLI